MTRHSHLCRQFPVAILVGAAVLAATVLYPAAHNTAWGQSVNPGKPQQVAIIALEIDGDAAPEFLFDLDRELASVIENAGFLVRSFDDVRQALSGEPGLLGCISPDCLSRLPPLLGTKWFFRLQVQASGSVYVFELALLTEEGKIEGLQPVQDTCPVCTARELSEQIGRAAQRLLDIFEPVPIAIDSAPAGASVRVGDETLGVTPFQGSLAPGKYDIVVELEGHSTASETIEVVGASSAGKEVQTYLIELVPAIVDDGDKGGGLQASPPFRLWKWPIAIAGVTLIGIGAYHLSIDGDETCSNTDTQVCDELYDTGTTGITALSAGIVLGLVSGGMFWWDSARGSGSDDEYAGEFALQPRRGGAVTTWRIRF